MTSPASAPPLEALRVVEPEGERYAADLLLLHGLWTVPSVWGRAAVGLAQRGWRCWLADLRAPVAGAESGAGLAAWSDRAAAALRDLATPPIVIGHDAGALVALALAERGLPRAAIAVAPLLAGVDAAVGRLARWRARWTAAEVPAPPLDHACFAGLGAEERSWLAARLVSEPGALVGSVRGRAIAPGAPRVPTLLVAQAADPLVSQALVEITARGIEADALTLAGGHFPMAEAKLDAWTSQLHRWIIRRAGPDLLQLRGDEDLREE